MNLWHFVVQKGSCVESIYLRKETKTFYQNTDFRSFDHQSNCCWTPRPLTISGLCLPNCVLHRRREQCQRRQYSPSPSVVNVFYSFSFSWSQPSKRAKLSNFDILLIENRKFANVSSTNGNYLVSLYPRSNLIASLYL